MASIKNRNGHYLVTVSKGYDVYGKKLIETRTFTPDPTRTKKQQEQDLRRFVLAFEDEVRNGIAQDARKTTFKEFAERWMTEYATVHLQARTVVKYTEELEEKIYPAIGHLKLADIKPGTLNGFFVGMMRDGARKDGKAGGYSRTTIMKTRNVVSSVLRTAVEWEILEKNPCENVKIPTVEGTNTHIKYFTPEQTVTFLAYIEQPYTVNVGGHRRVDDTGIPYDVGHYEIQRMIPEQLRVLFNLAVYGGLRKGELVALEFSDIDFDTDTVSISKAATVVKGVQTCKAPKTKNSIRKVVIPHDLTLRIAALQKERKEVAIKMGDFWQGGDWIFVQDNGNMMNYSTPYQAFHDALLRFNEGKSEEEQLPMIPFHGLCHCRLYLKK